MVGKACSGTMSAFYKLWTELCGRLRLRRGHGDTSEDDEGLPRSPCNSPTTADGHHHKTANKDLPTKSHSTCSDGSLRSVDSSEMDEDSYGLNSRHSSKLSLQDKRNVDLDSDIELGPSSAAQPLNHSAAHHKVSVRPKRTHGAPRRRRAGQSLSSALPATPEVNEDSSVRSVTPDNAHKVTVTELFSLSTKRAVLTESQLKCSSLPPGLVGPGAESKLNRSKSNSGSKSQDHFAILNEPKEEKADKPFFRKLIRNSGKKKKAKEKHQEHLLYTSSSQTTEVSTTTSTSTTSTRIESKPIVAPRSTAATRQRVVPKNIPITPEQEKREVVLRKPSPEKPLSPFDSELENRIKQRQTLISTSPPKISSPPQSPKVSRSPVLSELENVMKHRQTILSTSPSKSKSPPMSPKALRSSPVIIKTEFTQKVSKFAENVVEEKRSKVKLGSLSALQRKILSSTEKDDDDDEVGYKSLTEVDYKSSEETKIVKPVMKSHSFKTVKEDVKATIAKASSTDSIKVAEAAPPATYDNEFKIEFRTTPKTQPEENYDSISSDILKDVKEITNELVAEIKDDFVAPTDKSIKDKTNELIMSETHNVDVFNDSPSGITISGPSHTAIVNVTSNSSNDTFIKTTTETTETKTISKESQVSVTKIQLKHETINTTAMGIPEFMNKQLNKVEPKPEKNVIFTMSSPKSEKTRPATSVSEDEANIEIIEKAEVEAPVEEEKKPAPVSAPYRIKTQETPKKRSPSPDRSSQESVDSTEPVVMRKKSVIASPKNDEPSELMKVFAKRSRIFNDSEADAIAKEINEARTRDSDKENDMESPVEERKKIPPAETDAPAKEPLIESSNTETVESTAEVTLRKPIKNSVPHGRSFSLHYKNTEVPFKKPVERRMVSSYWNKNESSEEIITTISQKEEKIVEEISIEPKNFNQRKAEWEKRAQLAQKNNVP